MRPVEISNATVKTDRNRNTHLSDILFMTILPLRAFTNSLLHLRRVLSRQGERWRHIPLYRLRRGGIPYRGWQLWFPTVPIHFMGQNLLRKRAHVALVP